MSRRGTADPAAATAGTAAAPGGPLATAERAAGAQALAGTRALIRLALRRDRVLIPVWLAVFTAVAASTASSTIALYPGLAGRREAVATLNGNPTLVALYGPVLDPDSIGALSIMKVNALGSALVGVLAIILTVRHTRAEEETGRAELLAAGVVGRYAALTAALVVVGGTCLLLGLLAALGLVAAGLPAAGSFAFGAAWATTGLAFAAVAAITAQLTTAARAATGLASAVLGATYLLRALGDTDTAGMAWLSWLSPVGWAQQVRAFAGERWWVLEVTVVFTVVAAAAGYALLADRDVGAGLLPDRPGPAGARPGLRSVWALALRLHRGTLIAWSAAFALLGAVLGGISGSLESMAGSPEARDMIIRLGGGTTNLVNAFTAAELAAAGMIATIFGVQATMRLRAEESALRAESVLATAAGRRRWLLSHVAVATLGTAWLLALSGGVAGLVQTRTVGGSGRLGAVLGGALAQLPAALVVIGLVVLGFGLLPRAVSLGWVFLVGFLLIGELGPIFRFPAWAMDLSPFGHTPRLPGGSVQPGALSALTALGVLLIVAGMETFRRRDVG